MLGLAMSVLILLNNQGRPIKDFCRINSLVFYSCALNACKVADSLILVNVKMPAHFGLPRLSTGNLVCSFLFTEFVYIVHPPEMFLWISRVTWNFKIYPLS